MSVIFNGGPELVQKLVQELREKYPNRQYLPKSLKKPVFEGLN